MKKTIFGIGIVGLILISLASAGLVGFLSNSVSGTVEVFGPVFWLDKGHELSVNKMPSSAGKPYTITGQEQELFRTEEAYGGIDFYKPTIKFVVDVLSDANLTNPRGLDLDFGYLDMDNNSKSICSVQYISIIENGTLTVDCPIPEEYLDDIESYYFPDRAPSDIDEFYFSIRGMASDDVIYKIKKQTSYVEITGVQNEED